MVWKSLLGSLFHIFKRETREPTLTWGAPDEEGHKQQNKIDQNSSMFVYSFDYRWRNMSLATIRLNFIGEYVWMCFGMYAHNSRTNKTHWITWCLNWCGCVDLVCSLTIAARNRGRSKKLRAANEVQSLIVVPVTSTLRAQPFSFPLCFPKQTSGGLKAGWAACSSSNLTKWQ